jgi:hypothetical protein
MAVTQKLVTTNFNVESAASFVGSFANNDYFVFAGKHTPYTGSDAILTAPNNSIKSTNLDVYDNMIFAKRISSSDVVHVVPRHLWSSNTFFYKYDHRDGDLYDKKFYTVVDDSTEYNVYKCLFNNSNTTVNVNSTVAPSVKTLDPIVTGDGYIWKYMYSITKTQYEKFATTNYIPVIANTAVEAGATPGTIEVIDIVTRGRGYDNYISNGVFRTTDLSVGGVNTIYGAPDTAEAEDDYYRGGVIKITNSSAGAAGQYRRIVDYRGVGGQKIFSLDAPFTPAPAAGDEYEVYPYVYVWGDGTETTAAEARAIIDTAANSIVEIEMLSVGEGYRYGESYAGKTSDTVPITINSAFIDLPASVANNAGFTAATLQPIISPPGGHGSDPLSELSARRVCISTKFTNSEGSTIPVENDFRQVGIIKNPLHTNVDVILRAANTIGGNFNIGETVHQFKQYKLLGNVSITATSNTIKKTDQGRISTTAIIVNPGTAYNNADVIVANNTGTGGTGLAASINTNASGVITTVNITNQGNNYVTLPTLTITTSTGSNGQLAVAFANPQTPTFKDNFAVGDYVLVTKGSNNFLTTVSGVPQDYQITASTNATFTSDNCEISALVLQASGKVTSASAGQITLSNVAGVFSEESKIIGLASGVTSIIESTANLTPPAVAIQVNDKPAGSFNTAVQLTRLQGNFPSGGTSFIADENIQQQSLISFAMPRGAFHSITLNGGADDDIMYISNRFGIYNLDGAGVRNIVGVTSGATLQNLNNKYPGDFVVGSGQVLYIENLDPITRSNNKSEIIKIILEF